MTTIMTIEDAKYILDTTRLNGGKIASETDFVERIARQGSRPVAGGEFWSHMDVSIGSKEFSFDNQEEMLDCIKAARVMANAPVAVPVTPTVTVTPTPAPVSNLNISAPVKRPSRGQLWEECPTCGTEPVCAGCGYCDRHCKCGGVPQSSVAGEIYGGQN